MSHHPTNSIPAWKKTTELDRALNCATYLLVLGLISDGEREKIHRRMMKWVARAKKVSDADDDTPTPLRPTDTGRDR